MTDKTLRTERLRLGLTQQELADALGIHAMTVSKLELGKAETKPWHWLALRGLREVANG